MGTWGPGNFQDDRAFDFVWSEVQQPLIRKIEQIVTAPELAGADEPGSTSIVAAVEILAVLSENLNVAPPRPDDVELWKNMFLLMGWDRTADEVFPRREDIIERRAVIEATFDRLEKVAIRFHSQNRG